MTLYPNTGKQSYGRRQFYWVSRAKWGAVWCKQVEDLDARKQEIFLWRWISTREGICFISLCHLTSMVLIPAEDFRARGQEPWWTHLRSGRVHNWSESSSLLLVANHRSTATTRGETYHLLWSKKSRTDIPMSVDCTRNLEGGTSLWGRNFFARVFSKDSWEVISSENADSNRILISWDELRVKAYTSWSRG